MMDTRKHTYIHILNMKYSIKGIIEAVESNRPVLAWRKLEDLERIRKKLIKPIYDTLTTKQKKQLLDGWQPDTDGGSYIEVPNPKGWKKSWDEE